jgi:hypothetical protein
LLLQPPRLLLPLLLLQLQLLAPALPDYAFVLSLLLLMHAASAWHLLPDASWHLVSDPGVICSQLPPRPTAAAWCLLPATAWLLLPRRTAAASSWHLVSDPGKIWSQLPPRRAAVGAA